MSTLNNVFAKLKEMFGHGLKMDDKGDWYVGRYLIAPQLGEFDEVEEFVVYDTAVYDWEVIGEEPDDGEKVWWRCRSVEGLYLVLC